MATIGKIREKSGLLIFIVGLAMLAFILGDLFSNRGGGRPEYIVGEIHGEPVSGVEYEFMISDLEGGLRSTGQRLTEADRDQIRNQVWNDLVRSKVLGQEVNELGITVTPEEYNDIRFGNNILPELKSNPNFKNQETGQFDPEMVKNYFLALQVNYPLYLKNQRRSILNARRYTKYVNLLKKGIAVNSIEAEDRNFATNSRVDFDFVLRRYNEVKDEEISFTEEDVKEFYNAHKDEEAYKQVASRSVDYVAFEVKPTEQDKADQKAELANLKSDFQTAENDTLFVTRFSEVKTFQAQTYKEGSNAAIDPLFENAKIGDVVGPYQEAGSFKLSRVTAIDQVEEVNARHILLKAEAGESDDDLMARAKKLRKDIKRNNNFADKAIELSEDKGSGAKGGDLGWFGKGVMVTEFNDACFDGKVGAMPVVKTQFGAHIIEIMDKRKADSYSLAVVQQTIVPSKDTYDAAYNAASEFSIQYNTPVTFDQGVEENGYSVRKAQNIKTGDRFVAGLPNAEPVIKWALSSELGLVSEPLELKDRFVVALLTEIKEEGVPAFNDVRARMEIEVKKNKKAEFLKAQMNGASDLAALASTLGTEVKNATNINLASKSIPGGGGTESKLIGTLFSLEEGAVSPALEGNAGVYVFKLKRKSMATEKENYSADQKAMMTQLVGRVEGESFNALKDVAAVKDQRNQAK